MAASTRKLSVSNTNGGCETENDLFILRKNQEAVNSGTHGLKKCCQNRTRRECGRFFLGSTSIFLSVFGILQIIFPPYDILMSLRIRMTPGLPPYEWWFKPPDYGIIRVYVFNVTNAEKFLNKTDKKIKLEEIGPIIYRENLVHKNVIFNENGTLTFTSNRTLEFLPERNQPGILNKTIVMPNIAFLFIPSYFYDATFLLKLSVNLMIRTSNPKVFKTGTIHDFLWNMTDPILDTAQKIAPFIVKTKNVGFLKRIYQDYEDTTTVYLGPQFDERQFFRIDKYDGSEYMPYLRNCKDKVKGSQDDLIYYQGLTKNDTIRFFKKTLCRVANLKYTREVKKYGFNGYRYEMDPHFYDRSLPPENDCYRGQPTLPNGLIDVSACNYDSSVAASFPHFLYADESLQNSVEGLNPDKQKHIAFVEIEPKTGIPLKGAARSQVNIVIKDMKGFNERLLIVSNLTIPLVWIELAQETLSLKVQWMMYIQIVVMPIFQKIFMVSTFLVSFLLFIVYLRKCNILVKKQAVINKVFTFESEKFIKR